MKVVEKSRLSDTETTNLLEEVTVMQMLSHQNIVRMEDFFDEGEKFYIVTELMVGGELFDEIVKKVRLRCVGCRVDDTSGSATTPSRKPGQSCAH